MKIIAINGSPRDNGNTAAVLKIALDEFMAEGIETEVVSVGSGPVQGCTGCSFCKRGSDRCVYDNDPVNETARKIREADGLILAAPTYYGGIPGGMKSFLDRLFYSASGSFGYKVGTVFSVVRRSGGVDVTRQLRNYLELSEFITPPSQYWMTVYGRKPGEALLDGEGVQTVRKNARAFAWLLKTVTAGKEKFPLPSEDPKVMTNFIRGDLEGK